MKSRLFYCTMLKGKNEYLKIVLCCLHLHEVYRMHFLGLFDLALYLILQWYLNKNINYFIERNKF